MTFEQGNAELSTSQLPVISWDDDDWTPDSFLGQGKSFVVNFIQTKLIAPFKILNVQSLYDLLTVIFFCFKVIWFY